MVSKEDQGQTIKQLRGQISALARENKMLNHKMSLLEQNAVLKQNAILSSFLTWMEDTGIRPKEESHRHERDSKSPTALLSVKQEPISTELPGRSQVRDDANISAKFSTGSTRKRTPEEQNSSFNSEPDSAKFDGPCKKEVPSDVGMRQILDETRLTGSPGMVDNHSKVKNSNGNPTDLKVVTSTPARGPFRTYENSNLPENGPFYKAPPCYYDPYYLPENESAIAASPDVRDYWLRRKDENRDPAQVLSSSIPPTPAMPTSCICKRGADDYSDLKNKVGSLLEETRRAASMEMGAFADDVADNVDSRPVTSTPAKTPQKRVMFADETPSRSLGDPVSSVPRPYDCDPLNLFTPGKKPASEVSRQLYAEVPSSPADDVDGFVDSRDGQSFRRLTLNDRPDSRIRQRSGTSKRPISSRKDGRHNDRKNKSPRSKSAREKYSAKRDLSYDADDKRSPRPFVNVNKFFDSRENEFSNQEPVKNSEYKANYQDNHAPFGGGSRSKRSRYEGVTNTSPGVTAVSPSPLKSHRPRNSLESDIPKDEMTIEILENELQDIYKQNLDDEFKITEIRRNAVRRFDNWRDAMESEMANLEKDGRERLAKNIEKLNQSLPACLKCDCSTGFDGNSRSVAISEGELEDRSGLMLADLQESRNDTFDRSAMEASLQTESLLQNRDRESKRSMDSQTASTGSLFMANPSTVIFGEIAFQLERVVLSRVFRGGSKQLTGYTLFNMEKMIQSHYDYRERPTLKRQLDEIKGELHICGWNHDFHPRLVAHLVKKFGTFPTNVNAKSAARKRGWTEPQALKEEVLWRIPKKYIHDMIIILDCLFYLSKKYEMPLFAW